MTEHGHYDFVRLHYDCLKFVRLSSLSVCLKFVRLSEHGHYDFVRLSSLLGGNDMTMMTMAMTTIVLNNNNSTVTKSV